MRLVWLPQAQDDVRQAHAYISEVSPKGAKAVVARIGAQVDALVDFPRIGRPGRVSGTRELVITRTPYIVAYRIVGDDIEILAVIHGARRWPDAF
ncbi:MAG: type II toxin-antitoxin system RelE/ParE family toxin [Hyphomicrobium sp.]